MGKTFDNEIQRTVEIMIRTQDNNVDCFAWREGEAVFYAS